MTIRQLIHYSVDFKYIPTTSFIYNYRFIFYKNDMKYILVKMQDSEIMFYGEYGRGLYFKDEKLKDTTFFLENKL